MNSEPIYKSSTLSYILRGEPSNFAHVPTGIAILFYYFQIFDGASRVGRRRVPTATTIS